MRLARFRTRDGAVYAGRIEGDEVVPLLRGDGYAGREAVIDLAMSGRPALRGLEPLSLASVRLLAPIPQPGAIRDFYAFEEHVANSRRTRGLDMDAAWYEIPVFYFGNPSTIFGPGDEIPQPSTQALDYELEVAAVVGRDIRDATPAEAASTIAGYTIFNDWSARDIQRKEMGLGLGPAKGKDFASSFGPWLVTPDELPGGPEGRPSGAMRAAVNGREYSRGELSDVHWSFAEMISYASRDSCVRRADIIGSGTCGTGCILELSALHGSERFPWLRTGDAVELEVEGIGVLMNSVGPPLHSSSHHREA